MRKIIHVDMDAFYASVEQRDRPELRGRPIVVGGSPDGRGVVAAASYEARRFGVRSAIPCAQARRLCPQLVFVPPDIAKYREVSRSVFAIFREVTPLVEGLSLDEAYLDVTTNRLELDLASEVARHVKARIKAETGLTASAGVGPSKLVAKIASDIRKPDGLLIVPPRHVQAFLDPLSVRKLWGVGPRTGEKLDEMGLKTIADLRALPATTLEQRLGSFGHELWQLARGQDNRPVTPHREAKSRSAETTFETDVTDLTVLAGVIERLADRVARSLVRLDRPGRTVVLKVRYSDFTTITRSRTLELPTDRAASIAATGLALLETATEAGERPVRLVGIGVGGLIGGDGPAQLELELELELGG